MKNEDVEKAVRDILIVHPCGAKLSKQFGIDLNDHSSAPAPAKAANSADVDSPLHLLKELEASANGDRVEALVKVGLSGSRSATDADLLRSLMYRKPVPAAKKDAADTLKKAG